MKNPLLWIVLVILTFGLGWYFFMQTPAQAPAPVGNEPQVTGEEVPDEGESVSAFTVRYTDNGFSPESMTVPVGTTVTWINQSSGEMWVGSDEHPSHTNYSGTSRSEHCPDTDNSNFDQCARGNTFSFTFTKAGSWDYHNHVGSEDRGTIVVE